VDLSHVVFFFGSGVSIPSGMPDIQKITRGLFDPSIVFSNNGRYEHGIRAETAPNSDERMSKIRGFLSSTLAI